MHASKMISAQRQCWITPSGRVAAREAETCDCRYVLQGLFWVCQDCDTVYGKWSAKARTV